MSEVELGLEIDNEKFVSRFGFPKPKPRNDESEKPIVFYCMSGFRARKAQKIFEKFGRKFTTEALKIGPQMGEKLNIRISKQKPKN